MSDPHSALRSVLAMLAGVLLMGGVFAATAGADPYGELTHFGDLGTGLGQLKEPELAIGVNPSDNSVFVVDSSKGNGFRLQKFSEKGGKYEAVASAVFKPKNQSEEGDEIEGVAIDPELKRAYVLAVQERGSDKGIDSEDLAAGVLFAFDTEPTGTTLEPAAETKEGGVLVNQEALQTNSTKQGAALLEPSGIAVDPTTHDVIILATQDRGKKPFEKEATVVLQRVGSNGTLGAEYVDSRTEFNPETGKNEEKGYFEECECVNSPAVTKSGHVYVVGEERDEVVEIPASFDGATRPKPAIQLECEVGCPEETLTEFPGLEPYDGAQLSIGGEGRIYVSGRIRLQAGGNQEYGGALVFSEGLVEEGWTGGQSPASPAGKCIIDDLEEQPAIAAGKEGKVFMLDRTPASPKVVELGPNGSGCPPGTATVPTAKAGGVEVEPVPITDKVTLSSKLTQANALSVEWEFGDGTQETVSTRQQQTTEVQHTFVKPGKLTVKETIHTDNLATPVIKVERTISIVGPPTVVTEAGPPVGGTAVTLKGTVNPNGQEVTVCDFEYGTSNAYGSKAQCATLPGKGEEPKAVSAQVSGLEKNKLYHFRLVATNGKGTGEGLDQTFMTGEPLAPAVALEPTSAVAQTSATLDAKVNPEGAEVTDCHFDYGTSTSFGASVPCTPSPGSGASFVSVSAPLTGLSPGTVYHVRIVAKSTNGTHEVEGTFTTKAVVVIQGPPTNPEEPPSGGGPGPNTGVLPHVEAKPPASPNATIAGSSSSVNGSGAFTIKVSCPADESNCTGTVTLRTLKAVVASVAHQAKSRAAILTLATGAFTLAGGQTKTLTLHLSTKARALLARAHTLLARATVLAHDPAGATHTTLATFTLHAAKPKKHH